MHKFPFVYWVCDVSRMLFSSFLRFVRVLFIVTLYIAHLSDGCAQGGHHYDITIPIILSGNTKFRVCFATISRIHTADYSHTEHIA